MQSPKRNIRLTIAIALATLLMAGGSTLPAQSAEAQPLPGKKSLWKDFARCDFQIAERPVCVIAPKDPAPAKPWLLLAGGGDPRYLDAELLPKGFHFVTMQTSDDLGGPKSVAEWDALYAAMTAQYGLAPKVVVEGYGPGGLQAYNWASKNADKIACIFADAPVLDIESWPAGAGKGKGDRAKWRELIQVYGLESEEKALEWDKSPVDTVGPLAKANVPILHVVGTDDDVVPYEENTAVLKKRYETLGATQFQEILKRGVGHVHGIENPEPLVKFILEQTAAASGNDPRMLGGRLKGWKKAHFGGEAEVIVDDEKVVLEKGNDMTGIAWTGPVVRDNYEITVEAMRVAGNDFFCGLTFPVGLSPCSLILGGWGGPIVGLSCLDYMDAANNETTRMKEFETGRWYKVRLRVAEGKIQAWIDGEQIVDVATEGRKISIRWEIEASKPLGFATWCTTGALRNFRLAELTPEGLEIPRMQW